MDGVNRTEGSSGSQYNSIFTSSSDNSSLEPMDFIKLMIAQLKNQDFSDPMDNSQMVTQMAQFSNMQQMQQMAAYSKTTYAMSLVGKTVTASRYTVSGSEDTVTGVVDKIVMNGDDFVLYIGDKTYTLDQITQVANTAQKSDTAEQEQLVASLLEALAKNKETVPETTETTETPAETAE